MTMPTARFALLVVLALVLPQLVAGNFFWVLIAQILNSDNVTFTSEFVAKPAATASGDTCTEIKSFNSSTLQWVTSGYRLTGCNDTNNTIFYLAYGSSDSTCSGSTVDTAFSDSYPTVPGSFSSPRLATAADGTGYYFLCRSTSATATYFGNFNYEACENQSCTRGIVEKKYRATGACYARKNTYAGQVLKSVFYDCTGSGAIGTANYFFDDNCSGTADYVYQYQTGAYSQDPYDGFGLYYKMVGSCSRSNRAPAVVDATVVPPDISAASAAAPACAATAVLTAAAVVFGAVW